MLPGKSNAGVSKKQNEKSRYKLCVNNGSPSLVVFAKKTAFVHKLYAMLSDENLSHLIWWSRKDDDCVFALHPGTEFANVLTNYFKHGNVSSFVRQLHMYGFHKVFDLNHDSKDQADSDGKKKINDDNDDDDNDNDSKAADLIWEFKHSTGYFRKGDETSLSLIKRRYSNKMISDDGLRSVSPIPMNYYYNIHPAQQQQQQQHLQTVVHHYPHPPHLQQQPIYPYGIPQGQYPPPPPPHHHLQYHQPYPQAQYYISRPLSPPSTTPPLEGKPASRSEDHYKISTELIKQQVCLSSQCDKLHEDLRSTASDVLRVSDQIPQIVPILKNPNTTQYQESLSSIKQNFLNRAERYVPSPLSNKQQQHPQNPSMSNPFVSNIEQQRQESIHFWNGSNGRQPSFLVDPLNPSPNSPSSRDIPHNNPSTTLQERSKSSIVPTSPVSPSTGTISPTVKINKQPSSLPHLYNVPTSPQQHRTSSYNPPRSVPEEYVPKNPSIPNINHLTSQLRPSVVEVNNISSNINSISSNSTHNSTLYSAHSSISSMSSRNSNGSFSGFLPCDQQQQQLHHHNHHVVQHPSQFGVKNSGAYGKIPTEFVRSGSFDTLTPEGEVSRSDSGSGTKLSVSSLLTQDETSKKMKDHGKRNSDELETVVGNEVGGYKKVKSVVDLME